MTIVERFIDFQDWPTSRKTMLATFAAFVSTLWILSITLLFQSAAVDLPIIVSIVLGTAVQLAAMAAISWFVYRRGHDGRWTAPAAMFPFVTVVLVSVLAFGIYTSPFLALVLLLPPFTAIWFDIRTAVHLIAYSIVLLVIGGVLTLMDVIPFAPAMEVRDIDGLKTVSWFVVVPLTLLPLAVLVWAMVFVAVAATNLQSRRLAVAHTLLRRYVPSAVASRIEAGDAATVDHPQRLRVTALSSDVAGFTALADQIDPESLSQIINEYMATMSDVVESQDGVVTEFAGDGLMAIFGAPEPLEAEEQVLRALSAATAMHERLAELSKTWFRLGIDRPLQVRIGINTGVLSVGTFGSDGRGTYTAIGLQMNVAARIQAQCEPGTILLSSASWHLVKDTVDCDLVGEVTVKGVHFPISLYASR